MRTKVSRIFLQVIIWLAVYLLPYFFTYGKINASILLSEPGSLVHIASTILLIVYAYLNYYLFIPRLYLHRKYIVYAFFVVTSLLMVVWFPHSFRAFERDNNSHKPPTFGEGPPHDRPPLDKPPLTGPPSTEVSKLSYNVILFVICTFASISIRQQRQLLEMQKEKVDAELSFLKAQINPHFLFNTLNSIYALSISKSDDTPKAIIQLSELMRYILKDANANTVPLNRELNYISNYVALQKRRLGYTVQINYTSPTEIVSRQVAPLILTSFVENAFKHGVNPDQNSTISISISFQDNQLHLVVVNNKVTSTNQEETLGIGLKNATSRLEHLYPGKHTLTIDDSEKTFSVNLILQLNDSSHCIRR